MHTPFAFMYLWSPLHRTLMQKKHVLPLPQVQASPLSLPSVDDTLTAHPYSPQRLSQVVPREYTSKPHGCFHSLAYDGFRGQNTRMGKGIEVGLETISPGLTPRCSV